MTVTITANNIDVHGVVYHSQYYKLAPLIPNFRLRTTTSSTVVNEIDFGKMVSNAPCIRWLQIENVCAQQLKLRLGTLNKEQVCFYEFVEAPSPESNNNEKWTEWKRRHMIMQDLAQLDHTFGTKIMTPRKWPKKMTRGSKYVPLLQRIANETQHSEHRNDDERRASEMRSKLKMYYSCKHEHYLKKIDTIVLKEKQQKRVFIEWKCSLGEKVLTLQRITQCMTIDLEEVVGAIVTTTIATTTTTIDAITTTAIATTLAIPTTTTTTNNANATISSTSLSSAMDLKSFGNYQKRREVQLFANACTSAMALSQHSLQLGVFDNPLERSSCIGIENLSEMPLLYRIRMSGYATSTNIKIEHGLCGIIQPYATRNVWFKFKPSIPGTYRETMMIQNLLDQSHQLVTLKASMHRPDHFWLDSMNVDFGVIEVDQRSPPQKLVIKNISNKPRDIVLRTSFFFFSHFLFFIYYFFFFWQIIIICK
ncbi:hypothetical protein RFI_13666 [Reticulomyxa filosa]|uniref:Uncharacterized protein n=1 Tax=Reticulomyxa filosa TaxID=46433 RepID=X6NBX3_RETFI|nr:hypothetical protein RFI_13666 [Reticulomyxa filosa]|eukprot:ETO23511.1 hypothetical protein RFI_13666 [Reticulomyxa filosa]